MRVGSTWFHDPFQTKCDSLKVVSWCILTCSLSSADFKMVVHEMNFYVGVDLVGKLLLDL